MAASRPLRVLDLEGFYRPMVNVRDDAVVLFDAALPQVEFAAPTADLGEPEARLRPHLAKTLRPRA